MLSKDKCKSLHKRPARVWSRLRRTIRVQAFA